MKKAFLIISMTLVLSLFPYSREKAAEDFKIFQEQPSELKAMSKKNNQEYEAWPKELHDKLEQRRQYELQQESDRLDRDELVKKHRARDVQQQVLFFALIAVVAVIKVCFMGPVTTSEGETPAVAA